MTKSIQIQIDQPCHERWQNMTPNEQGRFCGACQKTVVDFSMMTDKEILDHISKASSNICGRVSNDQMNRDIKVTEKKKRYTLAYVWNLLLATFLMAKADAQITPMKSKKPTVTKVQQREIMGLIAMPVKKVIPVVVKGMVVDAENGEPIAGASVHIKDTDRGAVADSIGAFSVTIDKPVEVEVSAIGYEKQTVVVDKWQNIQVKLKREVLGLAEVVVQGYSSVGRLTFAGGISMVRGISIREKIKRNVCEWLPKKDVKAFPNPAIRGNNIQVSLALQQAGEYKLELMDAAGKVVMMQAVQMPDKVRIISILTNEAWSAGVYWIRISGRHVKNVYQTKVLLQ